MLAQTALKPAPLLILLVLLVFRLNLFFGAGKKHALGTRWGALLRNDTQVEKCAPKPGESGSVAMTVINALPLPNRGQASSPCG